MCLPSVLFGDKGYLRNHQKNVKDLSLTTAKDCTFNRLAGSVKGIPPMVLGYHAQLRSLCWKRIRCGNDLVGLSSILKASCNRLESLTLDINTITWDLARQSWSESHGLKVDENPWASNRFAVYVLDLQPGSSHILFPCLRSLRLAHVRFNNMALELVQR